PHSKVVWLLRSLTTALQKAPSYQKTFISDPIFRSLTQQHKTSLLNLIFLQVNFFFVSFYKKSFSLFLFFYLISLRADDPARVIVISPHNELIRIEFKRAFREWHNRHFGVPAEVEWRDVGGTTDALKFVDSEFSKKTNGIGIDVFFGGGLEPFLFLADKKLLERHDLPEEIIQKIPQSVSGIEIYDPNHYWFGAALSSFGILQNTLVQRIRNLPFARRWEDLARPELFGLVGAGDPRNSGTMNSMFEAILQAYGWERGWQIITMIGGNTRKFDRISSTTAKDVTLGETVYAFAIDFYGFTQIAVAGKENMTLALPEDFTAINPDGIAILKGAPNLQTARRFLNFVLSEDGQKLWFLPKGHPEGPKQFSIERMPIIPELYAKYKEASNIPFSPFDLKINFQYDNRLARNRRDIMAAMLGALVVDTHTELKEAWKMVIKRGCSQEEIKILGSVPLTEQQALQLAAKEWKNPAFRNKTLIEWQVWAQQKYRFLAKDSSVPKKMFTATSTETSKTTTQTNLIYQNGSHN
ncbi:MAG: ABC transporter substrate-binding protein, partial [Limisphaerales bacterium]